MFPTIRAFFTDPVVFKESLRRAKPLIIRGSLAAVGVFGPELVNVGAAGWWGGKALAVIALLVRAGDPNDPALKALAAITAKNIEKVAAATDVSLIKPPVR